MSTKSTDDFIGAQAFLRNVDFPISEHSTCECYVASHYALNNADSLGAGRYNLTKDMLECSVEDSFTGSTASCVFLPRRPYHHWIFPGDIVSIYFSTGVDSSPSFGVLGDPQGKDEDIRSFFGTVDSIKPTVTISEEGSPQVRYHMACSGTQKAFDRTSVYHNPQLGPSSLFGSILPGLSNLMAGISMSGTPATIPRSIALAYLGFGGQFVLPQNYVRQIASDEQRKVRIKNLIQNSLSVERALGFNFGEGMVGKAQQPGIIERVIKASRDEYEADSLAQIVDLFSYVEELHVDGRILQTPVTDLNGSLWQLMLENSNPPMNECFISLRKDIGGILAGEKDEWGKSPKYVPALVLREKPFSWVDGKAYQVSRSNASSIKLSMSSFQGKKSEFEFGDIFFSSFQRPANVPRSQQLIPLNVGVDLGSAPQGLGVTATGNVLSYGTINTATDLWNSGLLNKASDQRYVDRVAIRSTDIFTESLGLSDNDHFNFFTVSSSALQIAIPQQKYLLMVDGLMPIFIPESIKRYGLRVKDISTKFMHQGGANIGSKDTMNFLIRSLLLTDLWFQHQPWYMAGILTCKAIPKARIGMVLDIVDRDVSYYIEGISFQWSRNAQSSAGRLINSFTLTRGQPGLSETSDRFNYAPPDPVKVFVGSVEIPRGDKQKQPTTRRSPFMTDALKRDHYLELIQDGIGGIEFTPEQFDAFNARLLQLVDHNNNLITPLHIKQALKDIGLKDSTFATIAEKISKAYEKDVAIRDMPPMYKQKEDRSQVGKPPWATQPELIGKMWDPIRRPSSFWTKQVKL